MASIQLKHVTVSFPVYDASARSIKKRLLPGQTGGEIQRGGHRGSASLIAALSDVSIELGHNDRLALIGHNGAGKTTLLRVLAGIYEPAAGSVVVEGQLAPLFDIGLGMDAEATGYENILLRGLFLGMTREQIKARTEDIAEFTELGDFLHLPLRTYSTGMRLRLAFAVSTSFVPDILLLDEGIATGDADFMEKASRRLHEFAASAGIIVLASHSEVLVRQLCRKAMILEHGRIAAVGTVDDMLGQYRQRRAGS